MELPRPEVLGPCEMFSAWGGAYNRRKRQFALYDWRGRPYEHCGIRMSQLRTEPVEAPDLSCDFELIEEPVLFAGMAPPQFGHTLLNSIGRLWALDGLPPATKLYYITKLPPRPRRYNHLRPVLNLLGIRNEILVTQENLRLPNGYVASELFGETLGGTGTPEFYEWVDQRLPAPGPVEPSRSVYVSRSRLGKRAGRYACEDRIESLLAEEGYEIFAPEKHDLFAQVEVFRTAGRLIFAEGSALHLFGLVARPGQRAAVIKRRREIPPLIETQMTDRGGIEVAIIDAIKDVYWPPLPGDHRSIAVLDFRALQRELSDHGLISTSKGWPVPKLDTVRKSVEAGLKPGEQILDAAGRIADVKARRKRLAMNR